MSEPISDEMMVSVQKVFPTRDGKVQYIRCTLPDMSGKLAELVPFGLVTEDVLDKYYGPGTYRLLHTHPRKGTARRMSVGRGAVAELPEAGQSSAGASSAERELAQLKAAMGGMSGMQMLQAYQAGQKDVAAMLTTFTEQALVMTNNSFQTAVETMRAGFDGERRRWEQQEEHKARHHTELAKEREARLQREHDIQMIRAENGGEGEPDGGLSGAIAKGIRQAGEAFGAGAPALAPGVDNAAE